MKTTVKDFILDNLTDKNFEKLVNTLINEKVRYRHIFNDELIAASSNYLNSQGSSYLENYTFEILNEIKKVRTISNVSEDLELEIDFSEDVPNFLPDHKEGDKSEYISFQEIKTALVFDEHPESKNMLSDLDTENYKEVLQKEKSQTTFALIKFVYEILNNSYESELEKNCQEFSNEETYLKISDEQKYMDGYGLLFLLDSKSRYVSDKTKVAYRKRSEGNVDNEGRYNLPEDAWEFPVNQPEFLEYTAVIENLEFESDYIVAPFTFYLNKELFVPKIQDEIVYDILEQLIHVLTFQGFTEDEQISTIMHSNESYVLNLL